MIAFVLATLLTAQGDPVTLARVFKKGEADAYQFNSHLTIETRERGTDTWLPRDLDFKYGFNYEVTGVAPSGIATLVYHRPTMTQVIGESYDEKQRTITERPNVRAELQVSPANEILDLKVLKSIGPGLRPESQDENPIGRYVSEAIQLAAFNGNLQSGLDFAPRLPFDKVKPGDTWKRTVGFQPQRLSGTKEIAVQRLDYAYKYLGRERDDELGTVERIEATLKLDTDLAEYIRQSSELTTEQLGLSSFKIVLDTTIRFSLDPVTRRTLRSEAASTGTITVLGTTGQALEELRLKGSSTLSPSRVAPASRPPKARPTRRP